MKLIYFILFSLIWIHPVFCQTIELPVTGSKTHPSMMVDSIALSDSSTVCYLNIENLNTQGNAWFCADQNILLVELDGGIEHKLIRAVGIPVCPESHEFRKAGEKLYFQLIFPVISKSTKEIDVIEQCSDNCFSLKGIVLDPVLNKEIRSFEEALTFYKNEDFEEALAIFKVLCSSDFIQENHHAYSMYIVPVLHLRLGDKVSAEKAYSKLLGTEINDKQYFLDKIRQQPFFRELK